MIKNGKYKDFGDHTMHYCEIGDKKIYGTNYIKDIIDTVLDEENYTRAGSGTNDEGLNYCENDDSNSLKAIRYYFDGNIVKRIAIVNYSKNSETGEIKGSRSIIEIEEFNANPDDSNFKFPNKFKKNKSFGQWKYNGAVFGHGLESFMEGWSEDE